MREIYLDNAATTATDPKVLKAMLPFFSEKYGNPESLHSKGKEARIALDQAREKVSKILNCRASEIIFTGSATEANNLAILGIAKTTDAKKHLITTLVEHPSVLEPFKKLEKEGFSVTYLAPNKEGLISPEQLKESIKPDTALVSIIYANNEIGTIQPIKELGDICKKYNTPFHTDACQAAGAETLDVEDLNVDMMTLNGSKIYGPKGVGSLFVKKGILLEPIIFGGDQESKLRSGTHNVANIIGFAVALELVQQTKKKESKRLITLRDDFIDKVLSLPNATLNGTREHRLPNNINVSIKGIDAQRLLLQLDNVGIFCSTGSACSAGTAAPSHVLKALNLPEDLLYSTLRFSLGKDTTKEDLDYTLEQIKNLLPTGTSSTSKTSSTKAS